MRYLSIVDFFKTSNKCRLSNNTSFNNLCCLLSGPILFNALFRYIEIMLMKTCWYSADTVVLNALRLLHTIFTRSKDFFGLTVLQIEF